MSLAVINRDGGKTDEAGHIRTAMKLMNGDVIAGLKVSQRGAGANMSVDISVGDGKITRSDGYSYGIFTDAVYNVAITTADATNPRRDILVAYVDLGQARSTSVSNNTNGVLKIVVVTGTPAGSPADPSSVAIQAAVGAGNPWIYLGRARVAASVSSITNSVIDDLRTMGGAIEDPVSGSPYLFRKQGFNFFEPGGCVWTGDSYASTRNASMTAGFVWIAGKRLTVAAVTARAFTASKDTYVDAQDNGDGTALLTYTEVTNNVASPALANSGTFANTARMGIIVTGASNIANSGSINQGDPAAVLPIASTVAYSVTDSLGNLIYNTTPTPTVIGYRQTVTNTLTVTAETDITGLTAVPAIVPSAGRKVKVVLDVPIGASNSDSYSALAIKESTTYLQVRKGSAPGPGYQQPKPEWIGMPSSGLHTYKGSMQRAAGTGSVATDVQATAANTQGPGFMKIELA